MSEPTPENMADLRHALANPLAALLAEVQLSLMSADRLDAETRESLQDIEKLALRMRLIMRDSRSGDANSPEAAVPENP